MEATRPTNEYQNSSCFAIFICLLETWSELQVHSLIGTACATSLQMVEYLLIGWGRGGDGGFWTHYYAEAVHQICQQPHCCDTRGKCNDWGWNNSENGIFKNWSQYLCQRLLGNLSGRQTLHLDSPHTFSVRLSTRCQPMVLLLEWARD